MTGKFTREYGAGWSACTHVQIDPACDVMNQIKRFALGRGQARGFTIGHLERQTIFEYERERRINNNRFEELYPRSVPIIWRYEQHLKLLRPSLGEMANVTLYLHEVIKHWLAWCDEVRCHLPSRTGLYSTSFEL